MTNPKIFIVLPLKIGTLNYKWTKCSWKCYNLLHFSCWIHESAFSLILMVPVVISLCINFVFLVSILRVLLLKIKTNTIQGQNRNELIKVFRAAFVLVPLLGLHYIIICFRPENDEFWGRGHEILAAVSASYQVKFILYQLTMWI